MDILSRLVSFRTIPAMPVYLAPATHPILLIALNVEKTMGTDTFFCPLLGLVIISTGHEILIEFLKLKPSMFESFREGGCL